MLTTENEILDRLRIIETKVDQLIQKQAVKEFYSTAEVAKILGKAEFTVREWCRLGRIHRRKQNGGHGKHQAWVISHEEVLRIQREGLLPIPKVE